MVVDVAARPRGAQRRGVRRIHREDAAGHVAALQEEDGVAPEAVEFGARYGVCWLLRVHPRLHCAALRS